MKRHELITELKTKEIHELSLMIKDEEKRLMETRFSLAFRKLKNIQEIREIRKKIARLHTLITEKSRAKLLEKIKES